MKEKAVSDPSELIDQWFDWGYTVHLLNYYTQSPPQAQNPTIYSLYENHWKASGKVNAAKLIHYTLVVPNSQLIVYRVVSTNVQSGPFALLIAEYD